MENFDNDSEFDNDNSILDDSDLTLASEIVPTETVEDDISLLDDDNDDDLEGLFAEPAQPSVKSAAYDAEFFVTFSTGANDDIVSLDVTDAGQTVKLGSILRAKNISTGRGDTVYINGTKIQVEDIPATTVKHGDKIVVAQNVKGG